MTIQFEDYTVTFSAIRNTHSDGMVADTQQFLCRLSTRLFEAMDGYESKSIPALARAARGEAMAIHDALAEAGFYGEKEEP